MTALIPDKQLDNIVAQGGVDARQALLQLDVLLNSPPSPGRFAAVAGAACDFERRARADYLIRYKLGIR